MNDEFLRSSSAFIGIRRGSRLLLAIASCQKDKNDVNQNIPYS